MPLSPGTRLGPYQVASLLGAGGMGEVYAAKDTRLERSVAIKVLPREFSDDAGRRARFEREAAAIASLSHPNICTLHDVGQQDGTMFLVMEKLDGATLAARLEHGPMTPAGGDRLRHPDRRGPGLRASRRGRAPRPEAGQRDADEDRRQAARLRPGQAGQWRRGARRRPRRSTFHGEILGTLPYMAPEQLQGNDVDARADIFAFGAMLHEMVTGQRAFTGSSQASLIGAILHFEPPRVTQVAPGAPPALDRLIAVCLAKDPADRWSSASDVLLQLKGLSDSAVSERVAPLPRSAGWGARLAWPLAVLGLVTATVLGGLLTTRRPEPPAYSDVLSIMPPPDSTFRRGEAPRSRPMDGIWHFHRRIAPAQGPVPPQPRPADAALPARHGERLAALLVARQPHARVLRRRPTQDRRHRGRNAPALARSGLARGAAWSKDNLILFAQRPNAGLVVVPASGGEPVPVPMPPNGGIPGFPSFLPDGRHYLFTELSDENRLVERLRAWIARCPGDPAARRHDVERRVCVGPSALSAEHDAAGAAIR